LKNPVALKVLVWSRGPLVTLQIPVGSSFFLVEEIQGSLGQRVSFIDMESGFHCLCSLPFLLFSSSDGEPALDDNEPEQQQQRQQQEHMQQQMQQKQQKRAMLN